MYFLAPIIQPAPVAARDRIEAAPTLNVELLRRLAALVERHPERLDMRDWVRVRRAPLLHRALWRLGLVKAEPMGRITGCLAGLALSEDNPQRDFDDYGPENARALLGLDERTAKRLFHVEHWPWTYHVAYMRACCDGNDRARGQIAAALLRHLAKTGGLD